MSAIMDAAFETYRMMRVEFELYRHARFLRAHTELRGELLNTAGRAAHIDPASLFLGPRCRVELYASKELKAWFAADGSRSRSSRRSGGTDEMADSACRAGSLSQRAPEPPDRQCQVRSSLRDCRFC